MTPTGPPSLDLIRSQAEDLTARGIAETVTGLIRSGRVGAGDRLPTVRDLAQSLGVSPATVAAAWRQLRTDELIETNRRGGSVVKAAPPPLRAARRTEGLFGAVRGGRFHTDLSRILPDRALLPPLARALEHAAGTDDLHRYLAEPIQPALRAAHSPDLRPGHAAVAVNGGYDGLALLCRSLVRPGTVVAVEEPTSPRLLDVVEWVGGRIHPVLCDDEGPTPQALRSAVAGGATLFFLQSRAQSPRGHSVTASRAQALADVLAGTDVITVETDSQPYLSTCPLELIAARRPDRGVHVTSYSKALGPDLRLGVVVGPSELVDRLVGLRSYDSGWTSRIVQEAAAFLLTDEETSSALARAGATYAQRREDLSEALRARGFTPHGRDGMALWVPVEDEYSAVAMFAASGIVVQPGRPAFFRPPVQGYIRLSAGTLTEGYDDIADTLATARRQT